MKRERARLKIFRGTDHVHHGEVVSAGEMSEVNHRGMAAFREAGITTGQKVTCLFKEGPPTNLNICHGWFKSGFPLPRHSHDADCIYYILGGDLKMGAAVLGPGDGVFIPANTPYTFVAGPRGVQLLEIRNASEFDFRAVEESSDAWNSLIERGLSRQAAWQNEVEAPSN